MLKLANHQRNKSLTGAKYVTNFWDSTLEHLRLPPDASLIHYTYTYDLNIQKEIICRLGIEAQDQSCLLVPASTNSILFATWWLKSLGVDHLGVVCPAYFSLFHSCDLMGLPYRRIYMTRQDGNWHFPIDQIETLISSTPSTRALWVTNPIYCTGVRQPADVRAYICSLVERGIAVVIDECLCAPNESIARYLSGDKFLSIFSPHKTICLNALKFSAMVFDKKYEDFFESWTDVLVGGISASTATAIQHFCSRNFAELQSAFFSYIDATRHSLRQIATQFQSFIELDSATIGQYITFYVPGIKSNQGAADAFLERLISETGTLIIPGSVHHFDPNIPFSFRVNLARSSPQLLGAVTRVLHYLAGNQ